MHGFLVMYVIFLPMGYSFCTYSDGERNQLQGKIEIPASSESNSGSAGPSLVTHCCPGYTGDDCDSSRSSNCAHSVILTVFQRAVYTQLHSLRLSRDDSMP